MSEIPLLMNSKLHRRLKWFQRVYQRGASGQPFAAPGAELVVARLGLAGVWSWAGHHSALFIYLFIFLLFLVWYKSCYHIIVVCPHISYYSSFRERKTIIWLVTNNGYLLTSPRGGERVLGFRGPLDTGAICRHVSLVSAHHGLERVERVGWEYCKSLPISRLHRCESPRVIFLAKVKGYSELFSC